MITALAGAALLAGAAAPDAATAAVPAEHAVFLGVAYGCIAAQAGRTREALELFGVERADAPAGLPPIFGRAEARRFPTTTGRVYVAWTMTLPEFCAVSVYDADAVNARRYLDLLVLGDPSARATGRRDMPDGSRVETFTVDGYQNLTITTAAPGMRERPVLEVLVQSAAE